MLPKSTTIDLSSCDNEPIHLLGKIQSSGYLLAFDKETLLISYASDNSFEIFKNLKKGIHIKNIFDVDFFHFVKTHINKTFTNKLYSKKLLIEDCFYRCFVSDAITEIVVELEMEKNDFTDFSPFNHFNQLIGVIRTIDTLDLLLSTITNSMKSQFGFDRVMIYKFDELGDGEVIAEEKEFGLDSFLGMRYPASDIPKQARRLYLTNLSRSINDVHDNGIPILCFKEKKNEIDLSYSVFRSVSPVHIQYLKNMGVTATHAISIVINNSLWGMILFHNYKYPRKLDFTSRQIAQAIAEFTSMAIELIENKEERKTKEIENNILNNIKISKKYSSTNDILIKAWDEISNFLSISGFTLIKNEIVIENYGETPNNVNSLLIYQQILKNNNENVVFQDNIKSFTKEWADDVIAGFMSLTVSISNSHYYIFWRKAKEKIINWAGNPEKSMNQVEINNRLVLTPRNSFALWKENVKDKSSPWTKGNIQFATVLLEIIKTIEIEKLIEFVDKKLDIESNRTYLENMLKQKSEELYLLNLQLQNELQENKKYQNILEFAKTASEQLLKSKSDFISNLSHEIRTPLNGIIGLNQLIILDSENSTEVSNMATMSLNSAKRLLETTNKILQVSRIENKEMNIVLNKTDIIKTVKELLEHLNILAENKNQRIILNIHNKELFSITDNHYFSQIFSNLVENAIKYSPRNGLIEINLKKIKKEGSTLVFLSIEDNGKGIDPKLIDKIFDPFFTEDEPSKQSDNSFGLGLFLVKNYLNYLKGNISVSSIKNKGSIFIVTIPIQF